MLVAALLVAYTVTRPFSSLAVTPVTSGISTEPCSTHLPAISEYLTTALRLLSATYIVSGVLGLPGPTVSRLKAYGCSGDVSKGRLLIVCPAVVGSPLPTVAIDRAPVTVGSAEV